MVRTSAESRFWTRIKSTATGCWLWGGGIHGKGYGAFTRYDDAHRYAYKLCIGPIAPGAEIDHTCRVRHCVNPWHLEQVPNGWNAMQGGEARGVQCATALTCKRGHPWTPENTYRYRRQRECLTCRRASNRQACARYRARKES